MGENDGGVEQVQLPKTILGIPTEFLAMMVSMAVSVVLAKYGIDPNQIVEQVSKADTEMVTKFNQYNQLIMSILPLMLAGSGTMYALKGQVIRGQLVQENARLLTQRSLERTRSLELEAEQVRGRNLTLEIQRNMPTAFLASSVEQTAPPA